MLHLCWVLRRQTPVQEVYFESLQCQEYLQVGIGAQQDQWLEDRSPEKTCLSIPFWTGLCLSPDPQLRRHCALQAMPCHLGSPLLSIQHPLDNSLDWLSDSLLDTQKLSYACSKRDPCDLNSWEALV